MSSWAYFGRSLMMFKACLAASAVFGTLGVFWMTRKLRKEASCEAESSSESNAINSRSGFTFLEILFVVGIMSTIVGPFMLNIQVGFLGSSKNTEYIQAYNLAREKIEELKTIPPTKLKSDWDIYVDHENNIFKDEYFGPYARMKKSPEKFYARFSDVYTSEKQLTESVMEKFKKTFENYYLFDYEEYPDSYGRFQRFTKVEDLTNPKFPNNVLKRATVTVVIKSRSTRGLTVTLSALMSQK